MFISLNSVNLATQTSDCFFSMTCFVGQTRKLTRAVAAAASLHTGVSHRRAQLLIGWQHRANGKPVAKEVQLICPRNLSSMASCSLWGLGMREPSKESIFSFYLPMPALNC